MSGVLVYGEPHTKGSLKCVGPRRCPSCGHAIVHPIIEDDPTGGGKLWRRQLESAGRSLRASIGSTLQGGLSVDATFVLEKPRSAEHRLLPFVKPDVDKLGRMVLDSLESSAVLRNDAQVCELTVRKVYPHYLPGLEITRPGAVIRVEYMHDPDALPIEGGM